MVSKGYKRKLTTIMSADVVGYSRLMGEDEVSTVDTLTTYRGIMAELIKQHRGRVVDSPGDNVLAEFSSVVDAVQCGVAVQKEFQARNAGLPENRRMEFRVGINLGDVIEEEGRIYGDGVNIAARLEALAEPGGICISKTAFDHIESKLPLGYQYLGEQTVKNIAKPVGAYRVLMEPRIILEEKKEEAETIPFWRRKAIVGQEFSFPDKPSIAVLAFANISGDPEQEYFSDGITEEIITAISKVPDLFVIARNSSFTYKGKPVKVQQVSRELGVRYVMEGSVRRAGNRVRVTAQLIDAETGHHIWAERYDRELKDIFVIQDEITKQIITALQVKLTAGEQARIYAKSTDNLDAYLKVLQGRAHALRMNKEGNALARQMAEEAIDSDPMYGEAYNLLAITHMLDVVLGLSKSPRDSIVKAIELAEKAIALDDSLASVHAVLGWLYTLSREHDKGIAECDLAVSLEPNSAQAYWYLSMVLRYTGRHEEAITMCKEAIRLNPIPPSIYLSGLVQSYCLTGKYEKAIKAGEKAVQLEPDNMIAHAFLAVAYSLAGREKESHTETEEVMRINPKISTEYWANIMPYKNREDLGFLIGALRKAGLK